MDTPENETTPASNDNVELKATVSRKVLIIGSAVAGALSVVLITALKKTRSPKEIVVLEPIVIEPDGTVENPND